jgi:pimeloyl-ACP methyl ester carboxylesterase
VQGRLTEGSSDEALPRNRRPGAANEYINVGSVRLEFRWFGTPQEDGVVVLLHEGLGCVAMWRDFPQRLSDTLKRPVFAYSRQGYGASDALDAPRTRNYHDIEALEVLPEVLAAAGIRKCVLFGHSDGATIALILAAAGAFDTGLKGIVLEAPHTFVEDMTLTGIRAAGHAFRHGGLEPRLERYHGANTVTAFFAWHDIWLDPEFRNWSIVDRLCDIRVPTFVIQGVDDSYGSARQVEAIVQGVSGPVGSAMIDRCGHEPHRDVPAHVIDITGQFLSRHVFPMTRTSAQQVPS